jgi:hypothetical protein
MAENHLTEMLYPVPESNSNIFHLNLNFILKILTLY